jgi:hypothetical protein
MANLTFYMPSYCFWRYYYLSEQQARNVNYG